MKQLLILIASLALFACGGNDAGDKAESAMDSAKDAAHDAMDATKDVADDAMDSADDA